MSATTLLPTSATVPRGLAAVAFRQIRSTLAGLSHGSLRLLLPDGSETHFGRGDLAPVTLRIQSWNLFRRLAWAGDVGFGEAYMAGEWSSDDVPKLLRLLLSLDRTMKVGRGMAFPRLARRLLHLSRRAHRKGAQRNATAHYDLSNDFYRLWLDSSMTYSCALFADAAEPLEVAQRRKLERIAQLAGLTPSAKVLDIGCGWGSFLELAAEEGCAAVGITLSRAQAEFARMRLAAAPGSPRVEVQDYRSCTGLYDAIVAIEMLEAVGHGYLPTFFAVLDRLLAPGGVAVVQTIAIPDHRYQAYRRNPDFIQKYIFPGGHLPSLSAITAALTSTRLVVEFLINIGPHYALTLRRWREAFLAQRDAVRALGFDQTFLRMWEYYLAYCEAGFAERVIDDLQLVIRRAGEPPPHGGDPCRVS